MENIANHVFAFIREKILYGMILCTPWEYLSLSAIKPLNISFQRNILTDAYLHITAKFFRYVWNDEYLRNCNNASSSSNNNLYGLFKSSFDQMHFLFKRSIDICENYFRMRISKKRVLDSFYNNLSFSIDPQFTFDLYFHWMISNICFKAAQCNALWNKSCHF